MCRSSWTCISCWGVFAYSVSSTCFCTSHTWYWSDAVRYCKYKLTCSSAKCPREPLHSEDIFSLGLTVITSRIQLEGGGRLALISPITSYSPCLEDPEVSDQPNTSPCSTLRPKKRHRKYISLSAAGSQLPRGALFTSKESYRWRGCFLVDFGDSSKWLRGCVWSPPCGVWIHML